MNRHATSGRRPRGRLLLPLIVAATLGLAACGGGGGGGEGEVTDLSPADSGTTGAASSAGYTLLAWNDLGMHCVDGEDYSIFSILPPFNNLHAQLMRNGDLVTSGVTITFESLADSQGSINTTSVGKTNFWSYAAALYGADLAPDEGLTGIRTASRSPQALIWNDRHRWFEAEGIPITPVDDAGQRNTYPLVKVVARDGSGAAVATASVVLPVSSEMNCVACHGSDSPRDDARPAADWVGDSNPEKDWKRNILRLHDEKQAGNPDFAAALATRGHLPAGLEATAATGNPILCAGCHGSNALPGTGLDGIPPLTQVLHASHAMVTDPSSGRQLGAAGDRDACYLCHPGSSTQCLRGAMGKATDSQGRATMGCQDCHGGMAQVGSPARKGWLDMPNCQSCHQDGQRLTRAVDGAGVPLASTDTRFATNPDTPASGISLYRFSTGHGELQCEACHGATHAIYPSAHDSDNLLSVGVQGHSGSIAECAACHQDSVPLTTTGGPHGMHTTGATWVSRHDGAAERNASQCKACHGADYRGSPLGAVATARAYRVEGKTVRYDAGDEVTCYDCHNGPRG